MRRLTRGWWSHPGALFVGACLSIVPAFRPAQAAAPPVEAEAAPEDASASPEADAPADAGADVGSGEDAAAPEAAPELEGAVEGTTVEAAPPPTQEAEAAASTDAPAMEPEPEQAEPPAPVAEAPAAAAAADSGHDDGHGGHAEGPHQANPKIPPTGKAQMWFRSTTFFDYFSDNYNQVSNDDRFFALVNYVNFGVDARLNKKWKLSASARADTHNVFNAKSQNFCDPNNDGTISDSEASQCNFGSDYRLERINLTVKHKKFELVAGDFNVNLGRGMALSVRKIADIGIDATVKGGKVGIKTKAIELTGIGGIFNRQQSDFATRTLFPDPGYPHLLCENTPFLTGNRYGNRAMTMCSDIVSAGRFDTKLPGKVRLGGHYVWMWFGQPVLGEQHEGLQLFGGDISRKRIAKHWDFFLGVTGLLRNFHHRDNYPGLVEDGIAAYTSNALVFGDTEVLVEGKYYNNYIIAKDASATTVQYAEAPTLERQDQIIPAAGNTAGGRIRISHTLKKSRVTVYGNFLSYAFAIDNATPLVGAANSEMLYHGFAGMRWRDPDKGSEVQASAGYRWEGFQDVNPSADPGSGIMYNRRMPHAELYINQVVGKTKGMDHSLSLRVDWRWEEVYKTVNGDKSFHRGNAILGYGLSPFFTFAFIGGFSTEFEQVPDFWPGAEARINFLESSFLRIFAGRQVGGLLCVNGSCRVLPDFEGVRMDLILSF